MYARAMTDGIHGDHPISWQIDELVAKAASDGRKVVRIRAAKPFADNLAEELSGTLKYPAKSWPQMVYRGIIIETVDDSIAGWAAYDSNGLLVSRS